MRPLPTLLTTAAAALAVACAGNPDKRTLAELHVVEPDVAEIRVEDGLDQAIAAYRDFLETAPESSLTPEAMRRLADLKLEKEFGILGDDGPVELPAPEGSMSPAASPAEAERPRAERVANAGSESEADLERRATAEHEFAPTAETQGVELPGGVRATGEGPLEAIALYDEILAAYPDYEHNDQILYQKARAFDELGRSEEAIAVAEDLIARFPFSRYAGEVQFRRGEYFFVRRKFYDAELAYAAVTRSGPGSDFYELALYKLGWSFYKQELHEEALREYIAMLDYKVATGYDFDQTDDEGDERRIADTYRVISLSFSSLGGPEAVSAYFAANGTRTYEDRVYRHLGEFYLEKLRYHDAAASYRTFVELHPLHRSAPRFSMRVVDVYEAGDFPKLVLESKKEFASAYGLAAEYWRHFSIDEAPEVRTYLKDNLQDLANHYHALYQNDEQPAEFLASHFEEARHWYREFLASFPADPESPGVNYRMADLLLEYGHFGEAAREYERTAYEHPVHERSAAAGYAAIYAHREHQAQADEPAEVREIRQRAVASTLRFVDSFPDHEHAAVVLGAAADDLYAMDEYPRAIAAARKLIDDYPDAEAKVERSAWAVVANASLDLLNYVEAEAAYGKVLVMTAEDEPDRHAVIDNLAAAIYKQGEAASLAGDHRAAADHFLRIIQAAPASAIRPAAEYDAGAALIALEDWGGAVSVLDSFRESYPDHELQREATKQIASIHRTQGDLSRAAGEYERVAGEAAEPEIRRDALLVAGELYEDSAALDRALAVYREYVESFPEPLELAVETRFKIAEIHRKASDEASRRAELERIVAIDASGSGERTPRIRYLAARSALALTEGHYQRFRDVKLVQPFEKNLKEKQRRMDAALEAFGSLVDYEVGEVTAAATFYMAEVYLDFSQALVASERPSDLSEAERQDYELVLEEEAYPFEELAIDVHQKNLELMFGGVYNRWIEKSLEQLGALMPGRYAKFESSTGPIESLERYAYRAPRAPSDPADASPADASQGPSHDGATPELEPDAQHNPEDPGAPAREDVANG